LIHQSRHPLLLVALPGYVTIETVSEKFVPGINTAIDESTVGFKCKVIFETYN
jgi:hypothetical protein